MKTQSKRATYIDVKQAQLKLLVMLDDCIEKNRPLVKKEQQRFYNTFSDSTLGLGIYYPFFYEGKLKTYNLQHMEHAACWLAYRDSNIITMKTGEKIQIKELWKKLRDLCFQVFPHAKTLSLKISQEQIKLSRSLPADL